MKIGNFFHLTFSSICDSCCILYLFCEPTPIYSAFLYFSDYCRNIIYFDNTCQSDKIRRLPYITSLEDSLESQPAVCIPQPAQFPSQPLLPIFLSCIYDTATYIMITMSKIAAPAIIFKIPMLTPHTDCLNVSACSYAPQALNPCNILSHNQQQQKAKEIYTHIFYTFIYFLAIKKETGSAHLRRLTTLSNSSVSKMRILRIISLWRFGIDAYILIAAPADVNRSA